MDGSSLPPTNSTNRKNILIFWPVNGPQLGQSITTETSQPYPHHHSLFFGCDRVNGGNYWQDTNERGQILSQGPKIVESSGGKVVLADECLWRQPGKEPIIRDTRRITIVAPSWVCASSILRSRWNR